MARGASRYSTTSSPSHSRAPRSRQIGRTLRRREPIAPPAAGQCDARPPGRRRQRDRPARHDETVIRKADRRDRSGRCLALPADRRTDRYRTQRGGRRGRTTRSRRSNGSAQTASRGRWPALNTTLSTQAPWAVASRRTRRRPVRPRSRRMHLDERLGHDGGRAAGSRRCASSCATGRARGRY